MTEWTGIILYLDFSRSCFEYPGNDSRSPISSSTMSANLIRRSLSTVSRRSILTRSTLSRSRTAIRSPTFATMNPDHVSELAKQEGGSSKGSPAAQAQSQMTKEIKSG